MSGPTVQDAFSADHNDVLSAPPLVIPARVENKPHSPDREPPHASRNFAALVGDVSCFFIGMAFLDGATAMPALVERLGGGPRVLGALLALRQAAYYLPQIPVANYLQGRTRFKPFLIRVVFWGRVPLWLAAFAVLFLGKTHPGVALGCIAAAYALSWLGDGMGGVPWTAIVGRAIPARRRGKLFASTQVVGGLGRIAVGVVTLNLLGGHWLSFPTADAALVFGCAAFMALSWVCLALIKEPDPSVVERDASAERTGGRPGLRGLWDFTQTLPRLLRDRPDFARLALVQILGTAAGAAAPFIVGYAQKTNLTAGDLPPTVRGLLGMLKTGGLPGLFLITLTIGLLCLAPVWGWLTDRKGPRAALFALFAAAFLSPVMAILGAYAPTGGAAIGFFLAAYFFYGAVQDGWVTITNYLLEAVPEAEQPTYIGLMNAASAPALLLPVFCGQLTGVWGAPAAWIFAAVLLLVGLFVVWTLPNTRARRA